MRISSKTDENSSSCHGWKKGLPFSKLRVGGGPRLTRGHPPSYGCPGASEQNFAEFSEILRIAAKAGRSIAEHMTAAANGWAEWHTYCRAISAIPAQGAVPA